MTFHKTLGQDGPARSFLDIERHRLLHGIDKNEVIQGLNVETYSVRTEGGADRLLERFREIMILVNEHDRKGMWPSDEEWLTLLPAWFVEACEPIGTPEEEERYWERWRALSDHEKREQGYTIKGEVSGWIDWLSPDEREWLWWDAKIKDRDTLFVGLDRLSDHYPIYPGAFVWMLTVAGAVDVEASPFPDTILFPAMDENL